MLKNTKIGELYKKIKTYFEEIFNSESRRSFRIQRIIKGGLATLASKGVFFLVTLISVPLTYNYLDEDHFGLLMTVMSFIGVLGFADLGLGFGLLNRIPDFETQDNKEGIKKAISSTFYLLIIVGLFILVLALFTKSYVDIKWMFNFKKDNLINDANSILTFFVLLFCIQLPFSIVAKIQIGFQESHINQVWEAISNVFSLVLTLIFIYLELGVLFIFLASFGVQTLFTILNFIFSFYFKRRQLFPNIKYFDLSVFKLLMKDGILFFILQIFAIIVNTSDNLLISHQLGFDKVADYSVGYKLFNILVLPVAAFLGPTLPAYNDAFARKDYEWIQISVKKLLKLVSIISIGMGLFFYTFSELIFKIWISESFAMQIDLIIAFSFLFIYFNFNQIFSLLFMSKELIKYHFILYIIASTIALILKIKFLNIFGSSGLLWAVNLSFFIFYFLPAYYIFNNKIEAKIKSNSTIA